MRKKEIVSGIGLVLFPGHSGVAKPGAGRQMGWAACRAHRVGRTRNDCAFVGMYVALSAALDSPGPPRRSLRSAHCHDDRFAERGGVIRFTLEDNRVRFEVNVDAAHQADLNISSRLLTLAKIIGQTAATGRNPG